MIANYINIEGGANFKLDITKNDLRVQNPEFRLVCKTKDGAINIELPIINEAFESNYNAKIFIDDADDMADVNNVTISMASKIVSAQKRVSSMVKSMEKVGISIVGNFVEKLSPSIGGAMILSGFGDKSKNDGSHIIDSVELYNDGKDDFTRIFSKTLTFEDQISELATVTADITTYPNSIDNVTQYVLSTKGGKLEIFISNGNEYGVFKNGTLVGAKKYVGLLSGFDKDSYKVAPLRNDLGISVARVDTGKLEITAKLGTFTAGKTVYPNPQIVNLIDGGKLDTIKFEYIDSGKIVATAYNGITGLIADITFKDFPLQFEVYA